jgi:hypothetical protein
LSDDNIHTIEASQNTSAATSAAQGSVNTHESGTPRTTHVFNFDVVNPTPNSDPTET